MTVIIKRYGFIWDHVNRWGRVVYELETETGETPSFGVDTSTAEETNALVSLLKEPNVKADGRSLMAVSNAAIAIEKDTLLDFQLIELHPNARKIIDACENEWPVNKSDCSNFVKDVEVATLNRTHNLK